MKGLIHIYCGDGKGKTTAAIGLAVRAAGHNMKVLVIRFLKNDASSELISLKKIPEITIVPCEKSFGFYSQMTPEQKRQASIYYHQLLEHGIHTARSQKYDMLVLDEIMAAYNYGLVERPLFLNFIHNKPEHLELVMTGRNPAAELIELADYVSEISCIKHPYKEGIAARMGIEM